MATATVPPEHYIVYYQHSGGHPQMLDSYRSCEKAVDCMLEQQRQSTPGYVLVGPPKTRKQLLEHLSVNTGVYIEFRDVYNHEYYTLFIDKVDHDDSEPTAGTAPAASERGPPA